MFDEKRIFIVLLGIFLILTSFGGIIILSSDNAIAGTPKSGIIAINETWALAGSPYWIEDNITVEYGATLTIDPGVEIKFDGYYCLYINGNLNAIGTELNRIIITSNKTTPAPGDWDKIQINSTGHAEINYCKISYGRFGIYISNSNFNNLSNNRILSQSWFGIYLYSSSFNNIINNNLTKNQMGAIYLKNSKNNNIESNILYPTLGMVRAITLESSSNNTIIYNIIKQNFGGLLLRYNSLYNIIVNNNITECWEGIIFEASDSYSPDSNIIAENNFTAITFGLSGVGSYNSIINNYFVNDVMGQGGILLSGINNILFDNTVSGYGEGIKIQHSDKNLIKNNTISSNNVTGVIISNSDRNTIENNTIFSNNGDGLLLQNYAELNNVTGNKIFQNSGDGIQLNKVYYNNIMYNNISNNVEHGIYLQHSHAEGNLIHHNNFFNNNQLISPQCKDVTTILYNKNKWDNGYSPYGKPLGGNFWNDWTSPDIMMGPTQDNPWGDGVVDDPYIIDVSSRDNYPLVEPVNLLLPLDIIPPIISNISPLDNSMTNNSCQPISAAYSDDFGIDISSVLLKLDGINVTSSAEVTVNSINYTPTEQLFDGIHSAYLEVKDNEKNTGWALWSFTVDTIRPIISNFQPHDNSFVNNSDIAISAAYFDNSSIDLNNIILRIDNIDVTSSVVVEATEIIYTPITPFSDGIHNVYLQIRDNANNIGLALWSFTVDITFPKITNLQPAKISIINDSTPIISAGYGDNTTSINLSDIVLKVDDIDLTSFATITSSNISYNPTVPLSDGTHNVYLEVQDLANNIGTALWSFTVDATPPLIANREPSDKSLLNDNMSVISATYIDNLSINLSCIKLKVDDEDVTSNANVKTGHITYIPTTPFSDGMHSVYLEVKDIANNIASTKWTFTVDATLPFITNFQPLVNSSIRENMPLISANVSDNMGINKSSIKLEINNIDVTSSSVISANGIEYAPTKPLSNGLHLIHLEVQDYAENTRTATWSFTLDTTPPNANAGDDKRIMVGDIVNFYGDASEDNINSLEQLNFTWKISRDGEMITTLYNLTPSFIFNMEGQYSVELIVQDQTGNNGFDNMIVIVNEPASDSEPDTNSMSEFLAEYWITILNIFVFIILIIGYFLLWLKYRNVKDSKDASNEKIMEEEIEE